MDATCADADAAEAPGPGPGGGCNRDTGQRVAAAVGSSATPRGDMLQLPWPQHAVAAPLRSVWLVPEYLSQQEEHELLSHVDAPGARWTQLSGRNVQRLGGIVHEKAGLLAAPLPKWADRVLQRLQRDVALLTGRPALNHVLINAYQPGEGILPHQDGPLYDPMVAILSLGSPAVMMFTPHASVQADACMTTHRVWVPPRSLLLFSEDAYCRYLHGIDACAADDLSAVCNPPRDCVASGPVPRAGRRVSLTCRAVLRVRRGLVPSGSGGGGAR